MPDEVSFGEPSFSYPDDSDTFSPARIRRFSQYVLSATAWFRSADELIAAMDQLEPHVQRFWEDVRSLAFAADATSDVPSKPPQKSDAPSNQQNSSVKHSLINQHMMLAGFAIENLCKGYLVGRLSHQEREKVVRAGDLPKSLISHDILKLVEQTGMPHSEHFRLNTICDTEKFLLKRITEAVFWRGTLSEPNFSQRERPIYANRF